MRLTPITDESLEQAADLIRRSLLVAFPTETVYGLGADAFNAEALARIFEAKGRPRFDPLIVHIAAMEMLESVADTGALDAEARNKLELLRTHFWPGPLTLVLPKRPAVPGLATSGLPTVAVRMPAHDAALRLIALSGGALAAPSANPFGSLSPTRAEHVLAGLGGKAAMILDGGPTQVGLESAVLDMCHGRPRLLRPGGAPKEAIESLIGSIDAGPTADSGEQGSEKGSALPSPGMLKSHYAPRAPLAAHNLDDLLALPSDDGAAWLFFDGASREAWVSAQKTAKRETKAAVVMILSETGDLRQAAANLFSALHSLDKADVPRIYAQFAPESGLGAAINDRLRRASAALQ